MHDRRALNAIRVFARRGGEFRRGSAGGALSGVRHTSGRAFRTASHKPNLILVAAHLVAFYSPLCIISTLPGNIAGSLAVSRVRRQDRTLAPSRRISRSREPTL